jgi:predicted  nucleic acid-binding Zn-ribbon protein
MLLNERIRRMREEVDEKQEQMRAIERQRRSLELEQEINIMRREKEDIERKITDE